MNEYTGNEVKVFLAICRKTIGWHKASDKISYAQLSKLTGISTRRLKEPIQRLIKNGWIVESGDLKRGYIYDLNINETMDNQSIDVMSIDKKSTNYGQNVHRSTDATSTTKEKKKTIKRNNSPKSKSKKIESSAFISFWATYPRKEGKQAAWRCWKAKIKQGASEDKLVLAAKNYAQAMKGREKRYIKLASTFLGPDDHWQDFADDIPETYQEENKKPDSDQAERDRLLQKAEKTMNSLNKVGIA